MIATPTARPPSVWKPILVAGLLAGSADLIFALVYYGNRGASPVRVLQTVAGGVLGKATYQGGAPTAALGFTLHYLIAFLWAAVYLTASRALPILVRHAIPCGLGFGAFIYFFMNGVVLPLSALHSKAWPLPLEWWALANHGVGVGLAIALVVRKFCPPPEEK